MNTGINESRQNPGRIFRITMLCINILSLLLGFIYLFGQRGSLFWNAYGLLMLSAFLGNIILALMEKEHKKLGYAYLMLSTVAMLALPVINTAVSSLPSNHKSQSIISFILIFALFIFGGFIASKNYLNMKPTPRTENRKNEIIKSIAAILLTLVLISGFVVANNLLKTDKTGILEVFVPEYALFYSIGYLSIGMIIIKLLSKDNKLSRHLPIWGATLFIFVTCLIPFASTPVLLINAEQAYTETFGTDYRNNESFENNSYRPIRFSLPEYFYGTPSRPYNVRENIVYYKGTEGADKGLILSFDAYTPPRDREALPGGNSVLIRIHGGGWTIGNKGSGNFAQMNKYFASQGYVVFDIQYGLSNRPKLVKSYPVEATRVGNFSIDDMVRHIGIFTKYLADHKDEYGANLDSVFISGGSAGGQLISAVGLGLASGEYRDMLDNRLKIKGLIPFYPANDLPKNVGLSGRAELVNPAALVSKSSPPSLIFQGDHDGMVDPIIADRFRAAYLKNGNDGCAVLRMPYGGHASDFYFSGHYNQVFLYYMERFMYQYR